MTVKRETLRVSTLLVSSENVKMENTVEKNSKKRKEEGCRMTGNGDCGRMRKMVACVCKMGKRDGSKG